jgi:hypothetical protein
MSEETHTTIVWDDIYIPFTFARATWMIMTSKHRGHGPGILWLFVPPCVAMALAWDIIILPLTLLCMLWSIVKFIAKGPETLPVFRGKINQFPNLPDTDDYREPPSIRAQRMADEARAARTNARKKH